jgi:hypothetical protein
VVRVIVHVSVAVAKVQVSVDVTRELVDVADLVVNVEVEVPVMDVDSPGVAVVEDVATDSPGGAVVEDVSLEVRVSAATPAYLPKMSTARRNRTNVGHPQPRRHM